ncbi:MAG: quinone-interacting membrane-bound oxidoreductase complex subunit QmoC [Planctomycetota bacterium]
MSQPLKVEPDLQFIKRIKRQGGDTVKKCFQCATCSAVCDLSPEDNPFPRKEMLWAQWGLKDRLVSDPDVWLCHQCADCTVYCPRGAKPGDVLNAVRGAVIEENAFPRFMGAAVASPKALPLLILVAAAVIFGIMIMSGTKVLDAETGKYVKTGEWGFAVPVPQALPEGGFEGGYFGNFLSHGWIDPTFILGNLLIFICVGMSMLRFWKSMKKAAGVTAGPSFVACVVDTAKEIAFHSTFKKCTTNKPRYLGHLLLFYGFVGAFITTGLAFLLILLGEEPPIPTLHPIKILGNISFLLLFVGILMLIFRRVNDSEDKVGKGGYINTLFLTVLLIVVLTGGLSQVFRLAEARVPAYTVYYIHLTSVFFLLWYAPFSKFAHIFYRTMAIVFARSIGRTQPEQVN